MQKLLSCFGVFLFLWSFAFKTSAQNYIQANNFSGFEYTSYEVDNLNSLADSVLNVFPDSVQNKFKIYTHYFYLHNHRYESSVQNQWNTIINEIDNRKESEYYLIIGKEIVETNICRKINISIKLPQEEPFTCLDDEKRINIEKYIQAASNESLKSASLYESEVTAIELFKIYLEKTIYCGCEGIRSICDFEPNFQLIDSELLGLGFIKREIEVGDSCVFTNGTNNIFDYFKRSIYVDGIETCLTEEINYGKEYFEDEIQELPDTSISISFTGHVYILTNSSFADNQWEQAKAQSTNSDYVEYWVILYDTKSQKHYLYSRFTIGYIEAPVSITDQQNSGRSLPAISPWALALKALGNAAIDALAQAVIIRFIDPQVDTWGEAWAEVSIPGALGEGILSLIPWKKTLISQAAKHMASAFAVVLDKAISEPEYSIEEGVIDFIVGCGASVITSLADHPLVTKFGKYAFRKGLGRYYGTLTSADSKLKSIFNAVFDLVGGKGAGSLPGATNKTDIPENAFFQDQDVVQNEISELVGIGEFSDNGRKFWRQHEMNVTRNLTESLDYVDIGSQLTFNVTLTNGESFKVVFDNLARLPDGQLVIVDGKSSIVKDLSKWDAASIKQQLCTPNQKMLYDHLLSGGVASIVPKGPRAVGFIESQADIISKIKPEIHFYVNDYPYQGYGVYRKILKLGA